MNRMRTHLILHTVAKRGQTPIQEIKRWHTQERGWKDIGYHYYVTQDGEIQQGRLDNVNGAHCAAGGMNSVSLGICFEGHGDLEQWTPIQREKGLELLKDLCWKYKIPAENVKGHNEYDPGKSCPGTLVDMNEVRRALKALSMGML